MSEPRRLSKPELEILRRSVGASGQLPRDQVERLLDEVALLLDEREKVELLVAELAPPWRDVRGALNEIHNVLGRRDRNRTRGDSG